ncbi:MAG: hypothetical protein M3478_00705 [Planctomycetota bacterium]|nr:hypothetical protein [Planctomycetota bacterium]
MNAEEFWRWFASEQADLRGAGGQLVADRVEASLRQFDPRIGIEVGDPGADRELIFTAWSQPEVFPAVRALMDAAPRSPAGWKLIALKPPRGFEFAIDVDGLQVDASKLWFDALGSPEAPGALGLRVYVGVGAPGSDPRWVRALALIIETGIGEEASAQIDYIEPYGGPPADERSMKIEQLLSFVRWHHRERGVKS